MSWSNYWEIYYTKTHLCICIIFCLRNQHQDVYRNIIMHKNTFLNVSLLNSVLFTFNSPFCLSLAIPADWLPVFVVEHTEGESNFGLTTIDPSQITVPLFILIITCSCLVLLLQPLLHTPCPFLNNWKEDESNKKFYIQVLKTHNFHHQNGVI